MIDKIYKSNNWPFWTATFIAVIYFAFSLSVPFFSDMSYISSVANQIYDSNFRDIINPHNDNGTPPLYSLYLSIIWKIFGYKLWITHLSSMPFFIGLLYQLYKISIRFLPKTATLIVLFLLLIDPIFITQFLLMGYDIILVFLFLLAVNSILNKNYKLLIISTLFIPLINIRGFSILFSVILIHLFINKNGKIKSPAISTLYYIPAIVLTIAWYVYHYSQTGWFAVSNQNTVLHQINSIIWIVKNSIFELIAFSSNGRFFILAVLLIIFILKPKDFFINKSSKISLILLLSLAPFILIFTALHYPTGPRYFMISYPFLYILFIYQLQKYRQFTQKLMIIFTISTLFISNIWLNPYPYSNAWDSSLKVTSYFKIQKEMLDDFKQEDIKGENIISNFPLHKNMKYNYLDSNYNIKFSEGNIKKADKGTYIIYSNIYNDLELRKNEPSISNLKLYKEYRYFPAWIKVYRKE